VVCLVIVNYRNTGGGVRYHAEMFGVIYGRFHTLDGMVNRVRSVNAVEKVALMGGESDYIGEAKVAD